MKRPIRDALVTAGILVVSFLFSLIANSIFQFAASVPMVFVLSVFLVSVLTDGYFWGILASLLSVLAVNFAFTFPYFEFNFSIPLNLFSAVVMLVVAVVTCALTTKIKYAEKLKADFAGKGCFFGGVDAQHLLVNGTPEEVEADVKRLKEIFPTGLILSPSHEAILPDINPANVEALFRAIKN